MREIKFRAWYDREWEHKEGIMLYSDFCIVPTSPDWGAVRYYEKDNDVLSDVSFFDWADAELIAGKLTLMQYTGLKDKKGIEIYDGDVLQRDEYDTPDESMYYEKCIVVWDESAWKVKFYDDILLICDYKPDTGWVIGNIYENPELLSGEKRKEEKEK